jgi:MFS family permease
MYTFFFIVPYQAIELHASGFVVGILMTLHSICYIFSTLFNSSHAKFTNSLKMITISYFLLTLVYFIAGSFSNLIILGFLVCASGIFLGIFWPHFWKIHSEYHIDGNGTELCNSFCLINIGVLIGPAFSGFSYRYLGTNSYYIATGFVLVLFIITLFQKPTTERFYEEKNYNQVKEIYLWKNLLFHYRKLLFIVVWFDIVLIGYLEGNFRSAGPMFMLDNGYLSQSWGLFLALKQLIQIVIILGIKQIGPNKIISHKSHRWFLFMELMFILGTFIFVVSKSFLGFFLAMILFGLAFGFIYYAVIYFSVLGNEEHGGGRNLSGLAESLFGLGILSGSLIGGWLTTYTTRTPFIFLLILSVITIPIKYFPFIKRQIITKKF